MAIWAASTAVVGWLLITTLAYIAYMLMYVPGIPVGYLSLGLPFAIALLFGLRLKKHASRDKPWATVVGVLGILLWIAYGLETFHIFFGGYRA